MKFYLVGGAVRDMQLGIEPKDYDFVVVGSSPEYFNNLGWKMVGTDFPVFLDPVHGWEVALARIERKVGVGYTGFEADWKGVTLEQDLLRRDLTMNALAIEVDWEQTVSEGKPMLSGEIIDYFGGVKDIENKLLHPVSEAFTEDPVRVLRAARFLARYGDFIPSNLLYLYCEQLAVGGELSYLVPERVWSETEKSLKERNPENYFNFLSCFDFPFSKPFRDMLSIKEDNLYHQESNVLIHTLMVLNRAAFMWKDPEINFACLLHDIAKSKCYNERGNAHGHDKEGVPMVEDFCEQWKVPNNYRDLAKITCEQHQKIHGVFGRDSNKPSKAKSIMKIFEQTSALSKPERFKKMLKACEADHHGRIGICADDPYVQRPYLEECLEAVLNFNTKDLSKQLLSEGKSGIVIGQRIREERIRQIRQVQNKWKENINERKT